MNHHNNDVMNILSSYLGMWSGNDIISFSHTLFIICTWSLFSLSPEVDATKFSSTK